MGWNGNEPIVGLLRVKRVLDLIQAIDPQSLTEAEQEACNEVRASAYDRAEYLLNAAATHAQGARKEGRRQRKH